MKQLNKEMQREILFRAKRIDNSKWIQSKGLMIHYDGTVIMILTENENGFTTTPVIPETVCQFTGLTDMHGKQIFEGDILRITEIRTYEGKTTIKEYETPVGWEDSAFMIKEPYDRPDPESGESAELPADFDDWNCFLSCFAGDPEQTIPNFQLMIVGNIHDDGSGVGTLINVK